MDWNASLDTSKVVTPAQEAAAALGAMQAALTSADGVLKSFGGSSAGSLGAGTDAAEKLAAASKAATDALEKLKGAQPGATKPGGGLAPPTPIRPTWAAGQEEARAASGFSMKGKTAGRPPVIPDAGKAAGDASKGGASLSKAFSGASGGASSLVGSLRGALPLMAALAGGAGLMGVAKIAIGYKAMSQMQGILARTQLGFRQLFAGVDPQPLVRALDRFSKNFTSQTAMGRALGGILTSSFNSIFSVIEKAEPYLTAFGQGMILAFLQAKVAVKEARNALYPYIGSLDGLVSSSTAMSFAVYAGGAALAGVAIYAGLMAAPFIALGAAILAVAAAFEQASKLAKEWDGNAFWNKVKSDVGINSQADNEKALGITVGSDSDQAAKASSAGQTTGEAMGAGVVAGLKSSEASAKAAGESLAAAADAGVRAKAEIRSPARLFRRSGRHMGEGQALGLEDSQDRVQKAAASSLVPDPANLPKLGGGGAGRGTITGPLVSIGQIIVQGGEELVMEVRRVLDTEAARVAENLGLVKLT